MTQILLAVLIALHLAVLALLVALLRRRGAAPEAAALTTRLEALERGQERSERALRDELARGRDEQGGHARGLRDEVGSSLKGINETVLQHLGTMTSAQQAQLDGVLEQLGRMTEAGQGSQRQLREEMAGSLKGFGDSVGRWLGQVAQMQKGQVEALAAGTEQRMEALRAAVETGLARVREDNARELERMRQTVDEKLQGALEQRLGESFRLVSERLEQVHRGLGEMQALASGVDGLKRVLTNVKARGTWGEVQLGALLEQVLTREQYDVNVATRESGSERVEFAIRLPGQGDGGPECVWLPIDAKFPQEDYLRLLEAHDQADAAGVEVAGKALEARVRASAREIGEKYLNPPRTTDFAILFLPTEGLYAEAVRRTGLVEQLQRESRVVLAGPTTLAALLNSLQMGFRTLAIQKRSGEVWAVLGAVKAEFAKFGTVVEKVRKKLQEASNVVDQAATRTRVIERKLRDVQELPAPEAAALLGPDENGMPLRIVGAAEEVEAEEGVAAD